MARPVKHNCDYFSHDNNMRNHRKIKAIRTKFGISGYGIWCMILEHLTASNYNKFESSESELELMAGDFGVSVTEIRDVLDYCIKLDLLFLNDGFINSLSLDERLLFVYAKRSKLKSNSEEQYRVNGKFANNNTDSTVVSVTESTQSKVKESKVKESKVSFNTKPIISDFNGLPDQYVRSSIEKMKITKQVTIEQDSVMRMWEVFKTEKLTGENFYQNKGKVYNHFLEWIKFQNFNDGTNKQQTVGNRQSAGQEKLLAKGKELFNKLTREQSNQS